MAKSYSLATFAPTRSKIPSLATFVPTLIAAAMDLIVTRLGRYSPPAQLGRRIGLTNPLV
jgi:hypothetical protein